MRKTTIITLGLFCAVLLAAKWAWEQDAILNAIVLFGTAGVVPGTDIVLSPRQVYIVLGVVLVLSVVGIFSKNIGQGVRAARMRRALRRDGVELESRLSAEKVAGTGVTPAVSAAARSAEVQRAPIVITGPRQPGLLTKVWRAMRPRLVVALGSVLERAVVWGTALQVGLRRISLQCYRYGVRAWIYVEPHIRRMDARIEKTLKRNKDIAAVLHMLDTGAKVVRGYISVGRRWWGARFNRASED